MTVGWVSALSQGHGDHKDHFAALKANCDLVTDVMALVQRLGDKCQSTFRTAGGVHDPSVIGAFGQ